MSAVLAPMRWWHLPQVAAIEAGLFPADPWSSEQFWQELAQPTRTYLVALEDDAVIGYAGMFVMPPDADVQTVAVRADRQGRGVARQLLVALLDHVEGRGATHTLLEVRADNVQALGLYESLGFVRISERRRYYPDGGDALILRRAAREQDRGGA
jgi:[ribosomal protein S18]-alanine N-acetyltransferase